MHQDVSSANDFLERQIALMRELAGSLERAQAAALNSNAGQLSAQTLRQQKLCEELRQLAGKFSPEHSSPTAPMVTPIHAADAATLHSCSQRQQSLLTELRKIGKRVEGLNRNYAALLRRARRTVDIFCRVLANSGVTYPPPTWPAQSAQQDSRQ
jgi:hypothetical protein